MKSILCYGDSNTYGYIPASGGRYDHKTRWPRVLEELLNRGTLNKGTELFNKGTEDKNYEIIEEGLCGRTSCRDDPFEAHLNGLTPLISIIRSHMPLDLVIIMLGTNDLKSRFHASAYDIAKGVQRLALDVLNSAAGPGGGAPAVLMLCPPPLCECPALADDPVFGESIAVSREMSRWFSTLAEECDALFLDAGQYIESSRLDGVHFEAAEHRRLALSLTDFVHSRLGNDVKA
jgi:lysophospholipase L1-like esterase